LWTLNHPPCGGIAIAQQQQQQQQQKFSYKHRHARVLQGGGQQNHRRKMYAGMDIMVDDDAKKSHLCGTRMHSVTVHLAKRAPPPQILFIVLMCAAYAL
jgi:hypothetical protein